MLLAITTVLIALGVAIAFAKGKDKIAKKWQPIADYILTMIGVFVGVTAALLLTEFSTLRSEREKTGRLLVVAAEDLQRYNRDIQRFPVVYKAFKDKATSADYRIAKYLNQNPRRFPALPKLLVTSEYALSKLHPATIQQLGDTLANLQRMYDIVHRDEFADDDLQLYVGLMDIESKIAIALIDLEVGYQTGQVTDDMMVKQQQVLMRERLKPHRN